jgi:HEAT repeat protein
MKAAETGNRETIAQEIQNVAKRNDISRKEISEVVHTLVTREIRETQGADGVSYLEGIRICAREFDSDLEARSEGPADRSGAMALQVRMESGLVDVSVGRKYLKSDDPYYLALGVRSLFRIEDGPQRFRWMVDYRRDVRRAAIMASRAAKTSDDIPSLLERAGTDPDGLVRTDSIRALSVLRGEKQTLLDLLDIWGRSDSSLRQDIAELWASESWFSKGGDELLEKFLARIGTDEALHAAVAIAKRRAARSELPAMVRLRESVDPNLAHFLQYGTRDQKLFTARWAPIEDGSQSLQVLLRSTDENEDKAVLLAYLERLIESRMGKERATRELRELDRDEGLPQTFRRRVRVILARQGDASDINLLKNDLRVQEFRDRLEAASNLIALGHPEMVLELLANPDPKLRARVACLLIEK